MTDERENNTPGNPDGPTGPAADAEGGQSELDELLEAIDAAAEPQESPETPQQDGVPVPPGDASVSKSDEATAGRQEELVETGGDEPDALTAEAAPEVEALPDAADSAQNKRLAEAEKGDEPGREQELPGEGLDATATEGNAAFETGEAVQAAEALEAGPPEPSADAAEVTDPSEAVQLPDTMSDADELVGLPPSRDAGLDDELLARDAPVGQGSAEVVTGVVGEITGGGAEVGGAPVGDGGGTAVEPMPLVVAEAIAETQARRRRRLRYVLVPAIAIGLLIALTQVKLGGQDKKVPPAVRNWDKGIELVENDHLATGLKMLEDVVMTTPLGMNRTFAHARLAEVYARLGERRSHYFNGAIRHYTAVLSEVSDGTADAAALPVDELLYKTGRCFVALGSYETALEYFEQIDREHPGSQLRPEAQYQIAESLIAMGQYERARQVLAEVAETHRGEPLGERAFFRFAASFDEQAQSLEGEQ